MWMERFKYILALFSKCFLFSSLGLFIVFLSPSCFNKSTNFCKLIICTSFLWEIKGFIDLLIHDFVYFVDHKFPLLFNSGWNIDVIDSLMDLALHHGWARIVLYVSFPSGLWHLKMLCKALLPKVFDSVIVCVGNKVLYSNCLSVSFKPVHESSAVSFDLLRSWDG